ncbi:MAG: hypothetical protein L6Q99_21245 [Planctomycetes bacterium]|nr:hypothetical protein [Planctomycetota bacterium]
MTLFRIDHDSIAPVDRTTFADETLRERHDLQRLLRDRIDVVCADVMVLAEEFGGWERSKRRIDLLGVDRNANLVVIELKRTEDGGHMELQAIRYAAMVSSMTFQQAVEVHREWREARSMGGDAEHVLLDFLKWDEPDEDAFGQSVRIVLVAADFSREVTTTALWLLDHDINVMCVRVRPYATDGQILLDVQRIIPLPETAEFTERVQEKRRAVREAREHDRDYTRFDVTVEGEVFADLPKRRAVLLVVTGLCRQGVDPDEVAVVVPHARGLFLSAEGKLDAAAFKSAMKGVAARDGWSFDPGRWFLGDDQLIRAKGRTYALTNQWGKSTHAAIDAMLARWPDRQVACRAAASDQAPSEP